MVGFSGNSVGLKKFLKNGVGQESGYAQSVSVSEPTVL